MKLLVGSFIAASFAGRLNLRSAKPSRLNHSVSRGYGSRFSARSARSPTPTMARPAWLGSRPSTRNAGGRSRRARAELRKREEALKASLGMLSADGRIQQTREIEKFRLDVDRFIEDAQAEFLAVRREIEEAFLVRVRPILEQVAKDQEAGRDPERRYSRLLLWADSVSRYHERGRQAACARVVEAATPLTGAVSQPAPAVVRLKADTTSESGPSRAASPEPPPRAPPGLHCCRGELTPPFSRGK